MNTKNKSQIEVKSIQYKERSYYEWGCNMQILRKGNGEIAMTEGELARFFRITWRKFNNRLQEIIHNPNLQPDERSAGERVMVRDNELVGYVRLYPLEKPLYFDPFGQIEFAHLGHNIIAPCKVLVQGSILFYPFRDSGFS